MNLFIWVWDMVGVFLLFCFDLYCYVCLVAWVYWCLYDVIALCIAAYSVYICFWCITSLVFVCDLRLLVCLDCCDGLIVYLVCLLFDWLLCACGFGMRCLCLFTCLGFVWLFVLVCCWWCCLVEMVFYDVCCLLMLGCLLFNSVGWVFCFLC